MNRSHPSPTTNLLPLADRARQRIRADQNRAEVVHLQVRGRVQRGVRVGARGLDDRQHGRAIMSLSATRSMGVIRAPSPRYLLAQLLPDGLGHLADALLAAATVCVAGAQRSICGSGGLVIGNMITIAKSVRHEDAPRRFLSA